MPAIDASAPSQVRMRPFNPATWLNDHRARLARMSANARPDPEAQRRPFLIAIPVPVPESAPEPTPGPAPITHVVEFDPDVAVRFENGTVRYRSPHTVPTRYVMITHRRIVEIVGQHYGFSPMDLRAPRRDAPIVRARHLAYWMLRDVKGISLPEIGRVLGGRDHTSVLHGIRKVDAKIERGDAETLAAIAAVRAKLGIGSEA
ncbi:helix-turn-helix domain-containing protein [Rhodoplanes elegans]|nr:helix-turn-helix domain-containing protein [Rhodoplanes elegans]